MAPASGPPTVPGATYRVQLSRRFRFEHCRALVPYLRSLGVTHLYASPLLRSREGSEHGYDVVDPAAIDRELGTEADLRRLSRDLRAAGMGLVVDIVPNHMAATVENPWLADLLRRGPRSPRARAFDIDWEATGGRLVLPILGRPLEEALAAGEVSVAEEDGEPRVRYSEWSLPLDRPTRRAARAMVASGTSRAELEALLDRQHWRLVHWRDPGGERNYRRFFDIGDLIALRMEDPEVFRAVHATVLRLARAGLVQGVRVDHVDGLMDPAAYVRRLAGALGRRGGPPPYLVVEKILAREEALPRRWQVDGTTGYEFADDATALLMDPRGAARLAAMARRVPGSAASFHDVAVAAQRGAVDTLFAAEVDRLTDGLAAIAEAGGRDADRARLRAALVEVTVRLPAYRTYIRDRRVSASDRRTIERAMREARTAAPRLRPELRFLRAVLLLTPPSRPGDRRGGVAARLRFVLRWQQLTGAVTAKGVEDTAMYRHVPLLARCEVGSDPRVLSASVQEFHRRIAARGRAWPRSMVGTSTHDTKRSEDVRARICALSEFPAEWEAAAGRWRSMNRSHVRRDGRRTSPDTSEELLLYQTLVGTWPLDARHDEDAADLAARLEDHVVKAAREAKVRTSWVDPDEGHERGLRDFVAGILDPRNGRFLEDLTAFVDRVAPAGALNALAQLLLKVTVPGVPDVYQGTDLWNHRLVDPDNRRPVDFDRRRRLLEELDAAPGPWEASRDVLASWRDGRIKLYVLSRALRLRGERPTLFERGAYVPLGVSGPGRDRACAFARRHGVTWAVTAVPRLCGEITTPGLLAEDGAWEGTRVRLPPRAPRRWRHRFTGEEIEAAGRSRSLPATALFGAFPVALLEPA